MVRIRKLEDEPQESLADFTRKYYEKLKVWLTPDPADSRVLQFVKLFFKGIALLIMIAFSPVIAVILLFIFFAAV
ncbi:MAG TPA: hypothetical protein VEY32_04140 [Flavisolibacter sp.]|nr:hypothetical protein [Flavisolibacter sp.]